MVTGSTSTEDTIWQVLEEVSDPEIPVLSVLDLGIVRKVETKENGVQVTITPTYSGCPAMNTIATGIEQKLREKGFTDIQVQTQLSPAWTTDWLTEAGKQKLEDYGIAPPVEPTPDTTRLFGKEVAVNCPQCKSGNTRMISQFGSTACKSLYQCQDCLEPFDYFKCLK